MTPAPSQGSCVGWQVGRRWYSDRRHRKAVKRLATPTFHGSGELYPKRGRIAPQLSKPTGKPGFAPRIGQAPPSPDNRSGSRFSRHDAVHWPITKFMFLLKKPHGPGMAWCHQPSVERHHDEKNRDCPDAGQPVGAASVCLQQCLGCPGTLPAKEQNYDQYISKRQVVDQLLADAWQIFKSPPASPPPASPPRCRATWSR